MHKFRDLKVWQRAMNLVVDVYRLTQSFPSSEQFGLTSQLRRAATSIPLNISEGAGSGYDAEFIRFLRIALRSCYEVMTAVEIAERLTYCSPPQAAQLIREADQVAAMITGLIKSLHAKA